MIANAPKYLTAPKLHMCRGSQSSYKEAEQSWRWSYSPWKMESKFEGLSGRKNSSKCLSLGLGSEGKPAWDDVPEACLTARK